MPYKGPTHMDNPLGSPPTCRRRMPLCVTQAVAVRMVFWGGAALLALLWFVDARALLGLRPTAGPAREEPDAGQDRSTAWPHVRGPDYDGLSRESGLADSWPPEGPPLLWTAELGRGYSGLIAAQGRVYTHTQTLTEQHVVALDAETGRRLWEYRCGWPFDPAGMYPGPRATPTWHDGRLYFAAPDGLVGCLDAATGRHVWSVNLAAKFGTRGVDFGYACSPLVEDGKVILPAGGERASVVALDAETGATVWTSGDEPASYCSCVPITFHGNRQVVAFLQNVLDGYDLTSGQLLWRTAYSSGYDEHAAIPLYQDPFLLAAVPFRGGADVYELRERALRASQEAPAGKPGSPPQAAASGSCPIDAHLVRHVPDLSNDVASSVLMDGCVYGFDIRDVQAKSQRPSRGELRCLDWKTGKIRWSTDRTGHVSLLGADGKLFLFSDRGEAILARATPEQYEELGRVGVFSGEICWTAPALHQNRLYLRSPSRAACLYVGKPENLEAADRNRAARPPRASGPGQSTGPGWWEANASTPPIR